MTERRIISLNAKFFWILIAGVVFFFGLLAALIIRRESEIISGIYRHNAENYASVAVEQITELMMKKDAVSIRPFLAGMNRSGEAALTVFGPDGSPALGTDDGTGRLAAMPEGDYHIEKDGGYIVYKPLPNELRCHACHSPSDKMRGVVSISFPMDKAKDEIRETGRRIAYFALIFGALSEIFLFVVIRRLVLNPVDAMMDGVRALESGAEGHRVKLQSRDEFGALAESFNNMAGAIENSKAVLVSEVADRTNDIRAIAELSASVFRGDLTAESIFESFTKTICDSLGYSSSFIYLLDRNKGELYLKASKGARGSEPGTLRVETDHPFANVVKYAETSVLRTFDLGLGEDGGETAVLPILSPHRRRCRDIIMCANSDCPAYFSEDERCWQIEGTHCRQPNRYPERGKLMACLQCEVFPVVGVLVACNSSEIKETALHPLEILASVIAASVENRAYIEEKKRDINNLVKLHDITLNKMRKFDSLSLKAEIVSSVSDIASAKAAALWEPSEGGALALSGASGIDASGLPARLPADYPFVRDAVRRNILMESHGHADFGPFAPMAAKQGFAHVSAVPLWFTGRLYGCITMFKETESPLSESESAILLLFAGAASAALHSADLYSQVKSEKDFTDAVLGNMAVGVFVISSEGKIVKLNDAASKILRINPEDMQGKSFSETLPRLSAFLAHAPEKDRTLTYRTGEDYAEIEFVSSEFRNIADNQSGTIVLFRDVTEITKLRDELRTRRHFETMGKVVSGVAHEIRNPLFGILSIGQMLLRDASDPQKKILLEAMVKEIEKMRLLVDELLLYSRPSRLDIAEFRLNELAPEMTKRASAKGPGARLDIAIGDAIAVRADRKLLLLAIMNALDNALESGADEVYIGAERKNEDVYLTVKDNGSGIKPSALEKVFDPFFTTKKERVGLSLPICKKLIEEMDGAVSISSEEGAGTTVTFLVKSA